MSRWYRTIATIPHTNGLPADAVQNSYSWVSGADTDRDVVALEINARLDAFYTALATGNNFASWVNLAAMTVKHYDMTDPTPRFPYFEGALSVPNSNTSANDLPAEVAVVVSFEGERVSGANMRRRRGRIYIGPLQDVGDQPYVGAAKQDAIADAAEANLLGASGGPYLVQWAVYSRLTHYGIPVGGTIGDDDEENPDFLPAAFTPVSRMWVDNAWDTQRRRGQQATNRTIRTL